ncbi:MAG TPA: M20/M25/M40 family metallo-hydrolase [Thermoanaerobaculia bacterium]|nr:M20/M25/M40 family metallo-hydrolase [Thermoanaerobaculia bacterium]
MISSSTLLLTATLLAGLLTAPETGIGANAPRADVAAKAHDEVVEWLLGYLAIDTSNPPGNESAAAAYLSAILHAEGIPTRLLVTPKGRVNLYARLTAAAPVGGPLVLLHHMDVVPPGDGWTRRPFAAEIDQGRVWGRGAIDAKSLGICHLAALVALQRERAQLKRDVIFLAVADEETGGAEGTQWLWKEHADLLEGAAFVLNEGGSNRVAGDRLFWWGIEVAQKRPLWLRVTTSGRGGHGSTYNPASATHQLVFSLAKLFETAPEMRVSAAAKDYFGALARFHGNAFEQVFGSGDLATVEREFQRMLDDGRINEVLLPGMTAFFQDTVQITSLATPTSSINVVPQQAEALVDVRLLPDTPVEDVLKRMRDAMGQNPSIEVLLSSPPTPPSSTQTELWTVLERTLGTEAPLVPSFITGTTDSRYFRERGIAAYGFSPFVLAGDEVRGIHGADESIPLERFKNGLLIMKKVVRASVAG